MNRAFTRFACWFFILSAAGFGGYVGQAIRAKVYAIEVLDRTNLTPVVRPGDAILLAQHVNRKDQCYLLIKRTITTAAGERFTVNQPFEEGFGPIGGDKYILPVPTPETATPGPAEMYSKGYSWCGLLDTLMGWSSSEGWTLKFQFGEETEYHSPGGTFSGIGQKPPGKIKD